MGALFVNGIARGLNEAAKSLDKGAGKIAFLANDCDEPNYKKLITGLCREKNVPLVEVEKKQELGEWAGLCKWDPEGNARGGCNCSCVVVTKIERTGMPIVIYPTTWLNKRALRHNNLILD